MKLDWDAKHGPVTGPVNTGIAALAVGYAGHTFAMPWQWAALTAGAGAVGTHIAGRRRNVTPATLALRAAGWLGAGGWCSWAIAAGPWSHTGLGSLLVGALGLGAAMAGAHHVEEKAEEQRAVAEAAALRATLDGKRQKIADEWEDRIVRVCAGTAVTIVGVEAWETGAGLTLDGECGPGGATWKTVKAFEDALASDAKLPEGCGVEVKPGANRGAFLIDITTVNRLIGEDMYPDDYSPLTLNGPLPLGVFRDGSVAAPNIRQLTATFAGRKGSGKTNLANVAVAGCCRMPDNLLWVIDLNGGGLALPWLHAWHKAGKPGRPPVDWVADTPAKALAMAQAALRIAKARKPGYKHLEIEANDDKLPVSAQVPGILIGGDEIAEIFSPRARRDPVLRETGDTLIQVVELARAVAVNVLATALRVTQDVLSEPQLIVQSGLKVAMKSDEREMAYFFGWEDRANPAEAPYPGCGFIKVLDDPARPFKAYRIKPDQIGAIVAATSGLRPELDELSRRAAGDAYEQRWNGTDHLLGVGPAPLTPAPGTSASPVPPPRSRGVTADWGTAPAGGDAQAAIDRAEEARRKLHEAMDGASRHDDDLDAQFRNILAAGGVTWQPPTASAPPAAAPLDGDGDPRRELVYEIVAKSGSDGIGPEAIRDAIGRLYPDVKVPHAATIGRWLGADARVHQPRFGRYAVRPEEMP
ncbi:hypothetical protein GCM10023084_03100 [Streptomyces lacrimifluminis]|uniref:hypothetical protein n=1 Tax=Streptomyces lacrimifluminis TaxID=1500077 RepID=UPI0031E864F0